MLCSPNRAKITLDRQGGMQKFLLENEPEKQETISTKLFILHNTALNNEKPSNRDMRQCVGGTVGKREGQRCARALSSWSKQFIFPIDSEIKAQKSRKHAADLLSQPYSYSKSRFEWAAGTAGLMFTLLLTMWHFDNIPLRAASIGRMFWEQTASEACCSAGKAAAAECDMTWATIHSVWKWCKRRSQLRSRGFVIQYPTCYIEYVNKWITVKAHNQQLRQCNKTQI